MSAYRNTLKSTDQVWNVASQRRGVVDAQPREKSVMISVIYDGTTTPRPTYIGDLRFVVPGGSHEEDPPIVGELPPRPETAPVQRPPRQPAPAAVRLLPITPLESLEAKFAANNLRRETIQVEFVALGRENEKIEQAIKVLRA